MSGKPTVPISEVTDPGVSPSATATWDPAGDGLSESIVSVMGGLEHSVRFYEELFCEERPQSWCFSLSVSTTTADKCTTRMCATPGTIS